MLTVELYIAYRFACRLGRLLLILLYNLFILLILIPLVITVTLRPKQLLSLELVS